MTDHNHPDHEHTDRTHPLTREYTDYADRVWRGAESLERHLRGQFTGTELIRLGEHTGFFPAFANVAVFDTGDGLVLVDSGDFRTAGTLHQAVRNWSPAPVRSVVFTHGHIDHVFGVTPFDQEAEAAQRQRPEVIGHELVAERFDRYVRTAGYNTSINRRQFGIPTLKWPTAYRYPDTTYRSQRTVRRGNLTFELVHARGETDDATYVWVPEQRTLCTGDLFIWNAPNAGNPQKVQRYPEEWAAALREMAQLGAEVLLPGHGLPIIGADRVTQAMEESAQLLESLCEQTRTLMNEGRTLDEIVHTVRVPQWLLDRPYLHPAYDEPEFVVRNLWRLWGGWYDQNPAHLKPAPQPALAAELARAAGGADQLSDRARALLDRGELRLAAHLAEFAAQAAPHDPDIARVRSEVYAHRARQESSTMARGVFNWASAQAAAVAEDTDTSTELTRSSAGARRAGGAIAVGMVEGDQEPTTDRP